MTALKQAALSRFNIFGLCSAKKSLRETYGPDLSGFHTGFFSREGTFVCGKVDQLWP